MAHCAAYVQLAVRAEGQVGVGIGDVAADAALVVADGQHRAQRTAALELQRQAGAVAFQGVAHHGGRRQGAAQGRRGHGEGFVYLTGALGEVAAANGRRLHQAVGGNGSYDTICHSYTTSFADFALRFCAVFLLCHSEPVLALAWESVCSAIFSRS